MTTSDRPPRSAPAPAADREAGPSIEAAQPDGSAPWNRDAPYRRALVVANPIAGRGRGGAVARETVAGLDRLGIPTELHLTKARGDGRARVRCMDPEVDLVVSVGGDGTLREVFDGLVDPEIPVGVLPLGTANVLSLDLGLPRDVDRALEVIAAKKSTAIDVGRVNGHLTFLVTGVGLDAMAVREVERRRTGPITKWTYTGAILRALKQYVPPRLEVVIDGAAVKGEFGLVLISNIINYGGLIKLSADRRLDDRLWEVYLFGEASPRKLVQTAVRGLVSHLPGGPCEMRRAKRVEVRSDQPVPYHTDGDYRGETPVEFELLDHQYRLLVP